MDIDRLRSRVCVALVVMIGGVMGCGEAVFPTARLEGQVAVDNKPIADGVIGFVPLDSKHGRGVTGKILDGRYSVPGVPQGKVRVYLTAVKFTGRMLDYMGAKVPEQISLIPSNYASGIDVEVRGDDSNRDFNITSR
jgi:hypothetical protein